MAHGVPKSVLDMLATVPLFSTCTKAEQQSIAGLGTRISVREGAVLTTQGEPGKEFFLLTAGEAQCLVDGSEVAVLSTGEFFGEVALLESHPRNATVVAKNGAEVLVFSVPEFRSLLQTAPAIADKIRTAAAGRSNS